jgi:hypothetical protein
MTARFVSALEEFRRVAQSLNHQNPALRRLLERSFSDDCERAADAMRRIEREFDPALAALLWSFYWVRQGDLAQARRELESIHRSGQTQSLWGGMSLMMLGEICLELGETKEGAAAIRRARKILEPPP